MVVPAVLVARQVVEMQTKTMTMLLLTSSLEGRFTSPCVMLLVMLRPRVK